MRYKVLRLLRAGTNFLGPYYYDLLQRDTFCSLSLEEMYLFKLIHQLNVRMDSHEQIIQAHGINLCCDEKIKSNPLLREVPPAPPSPPRLFKTFDASNWQVND